MAKKIKQEDLAAHFDESSDWSKDRYLTALNEKAFWKKVAIGGLMFGGLACGSVMALLPLHRAVPTVVTVDKHTGDYRVNRGSYQVNINDPKQEKRMITDLYKYVNAREGFTRGEAEAKYNTSYLMSCSSVRSEVSAYFIPDRNPRSPLLTMKVNDEDKVDIINHTFLPTDRNDLKLAQIRFDLTEKRAGRAKTKQRKLATVTYHYSKKNIPKEANDYALNAFGFCATNYRVDNEGEKIDLEREAEKAKYTGAR